MSVSGGTLMAIVRSFCPAGCCRVRHSGALPVLRIVAWCLPITTLGVIQSAVLTRGLAVRTQASGG